VKGLTTAAAAGGGAAGVGQGAGGQKETATGGVAGESDAVLLIP